MVKFNELPEWRQKQIKDWMVSLGTFRIGGKEFSFDANAVEWEMPTRLQLFWRWLYEKIKQEE
jgi:hypothetical protein